MPIYCLMKTGAPLSEAMREHLYRLAWKLIKTGKSKVRFSAGTYEGMVWTKGERGLLGTTSGQYFDAIVESNQVSTRVTYLVETNNFDEDGRGAWLETGQGSGAQPSVN